MSEATKRVQVGVRLDVEEAAQLRKLARVFGVGGPAALRMLLRLKADEVMQTNASGR